MDSLYCITNIKLEITHQNEGTIRPQKRDRKAEEQQTPQFQEEEWR